MKTNVGSRKPPIPPTLQRRKGLGCIKTMTELVVDSSNPQHKFMKLSILSMERDRKVKELVVAKQLIESLRQRLRQIEEESVQLLAELHHKTTIHKELGVSPNGTETVTESDPAQPPGFMLKY
jgi:hypothetical protein